MARVTVLSHWCQLIENLQHSPLKFYDAVEAAIKRRQIPEADTSRVEHHEGGAFAAKREYLHVQRKNLSFDICGAPFGTGFFVSEWFGKESSKGGILLFIGIVVVSLILVQAVSSLIGGLVGFFFWFIGMPGLLLLLGHLISEGKIGGEDAVLSTPVFGFLYDKIFHPSSYYKLDTIQMYQAAIHAAVLEVVDEITKTNGLRALSESERKPVMKALAGKA